MNVLKNYDLFSEAVGFEMNGNKRYPTNIGAMLSFIIYITCIVTSILFGLEIFRRKKPIVSESIEYNETERLYLRDFPIFFSLSDGVGNFINIKDYYSMQIYKSNYTEDGLREFAGYINKDDENISNISPCYKRHFEKIKDKIDEKLIDDIINTQHFYCIKNFENDDFIFQNN